MTQNNGKTATLRRLGPPALWTGVAGGAGFGASYIAGTPQGIWIFAIMCGAATVKALLDWHMNLAKLTQHTTVELARLRSSETIELERIRSAEWKNLCDNEIKSSQQQIDENIALSEMEFKRRQAERLCELEKIRITASAIYQENISHAQAEAIGKGMDPTLMSNEEPSKILSLVG